MRSFLFALQFLTIFPAGTKLVADSGRLRSSTLYFPIVGLILGLILAAINNLLSLMPIALLLKNAVLVILLIVLTAGLHLDGLTDTFDALLSRKDRPEMLEIMRDAHIGTMGVLSLICTVLLKISLLCSLNQEVIGLSLILMCALGRYSLVLALFLFPYIRKEGKAKIFAKWIDFKIFSLATGISLLCGLIFLGLKGLITFVVVVLFTFFAGRFITRKIGGMTGDTLGAIDELTEVFVLLNIFILTRG